MSQEMQPTPSISTGSGECPGNCQTTPADAVNYMNAEIVWARTFIDAWSDNALRKRLEKAADEVRLNTDPEAVNKLLLDRATNVYKMSITMPPGVTLQIVFDSATRVHLIMPAEQNIPPSPLDMVPHAL